MVTKTKTADKTETTAPAAAPKMKVSKPKVTEPVSLAATTETTAPAAAADTSEGTTIAADDQIVLIASEIENIKEDKAFKLLPSLLEDINRNHFKIGGLLSKVQSEGWFQDKGFETFKSFVEATYGMKYRKAMYFIEIYNCLVAAEIPWGKVSHLGWTKLLEIIKYLTADNVDEWLAMIDGLTVDQIRELVLQKTKGTSSPGAGTENPTDVKKITSMTFKLHEDQKATVREALDKCKHETGTEFDNVALEAICLDYLGSAPKVQASLKDIMAGKSLEEVFEVVGELFPEYNITVSPVEE